MTTLARTREAFHGVIGAKRLGIRCAGRHIPRIGALFARVPESHTALEVLEVVPTDDNFLRSGPALTRHRCLGLGCVQQVFTKGVKFGC